MGDGQAALLPYRLRTVRVGVQITLPTLVLLAAYPLMSSTTDLRVSAARTSSRSSAWMLRAADDC